jgi:lipid A ethanolaminephosphotransferase
MTTSTQAPRPGGRPDLSPFLLNVLVATYLIAICNATFWGHLFRIFEGRTLTAVVFAAAVWALMLLVISLLAVRRAQKAVLAALLFGAAVTSYYVDVMGVVVDRDMIQNAMTTTYAEAKHLITVQFLTHVLLYGVIPSGFVLWVRIRRATVLRGLVGTGLVTALSTALLVGLLFTNLKAYSTVLRADKELMAALQPLAPMSGALRYARMMLGSARIVVQPTGTDAQPGLELARAEKPILMVIVAGETGRAQNWSLGGYARDTNPELRHRDGDLAAVHVLAPDQDRVFLRRRPWAGKPAGRAGARRVQGRMVGQQLQSQEHRRPHPLAPDDGRGRAGILHPGMH